MGIEANQNWLEDSDVNKANKHDQVPSRNEPFPRVDQTLLGFRISVIDQDVFIA
jgi:hypothetical protein